MTGKMPETIAFMNQWEKLPRLWPFPRTVLGKISLLYTQITAPCEKEKKQMKLVRNQRSSTPCAPEKKTQETPASDAAHATEPISSSLRRPILSMIDMA